MTIQTENVNESIPQNKEIVNETVKEVNETPEQINWKKFREDREGERKEKEELARKAQEKEKEALALKAAIEAIVNKPTASNPIQDEEKSEDQVLQEKINLILEARERRYEEERKRRESQEYPEKLVQVYNDFNQVCTSENLDYLEYHYPEVASAFKMAPDGFDKWSNIYKAVKKLIPNPQSTKDQKKAEKNALKPQSISVSGLTQTGDSAPRNLDDQRRQDNWKRMQRVMKGVN